MTKIVVPPATRNAPTLETPLAPELCPRDLDIDDDARRSAGRMAQMPQDSGVPLGVENRSLDRVDAG